MAGRLISELRLMQRRALRLLTFRPIALHPHRPSLSALLLVLAVSAVIALLSQLTISGGSGLGFNEYGVSDGLASLSLIAGGAALASWGAACTRLRRLICDLAAVNAAGNILIAAIFAVYVYGGFMVPTPSETMQWIWWGLDWGLFAYLACVVWRIGRSLWGGELRAPGLRLVAVSLLPLLLVPQQPIIYGDMTDWTRVDIWEMSRQALARIAEEQPGNEVQPYSPEQTEVEDTLFRQPALLDKALAALTPSDDTRPEIFFLAAAPSSAQDVFAHEVTAAQQLFDQRFGTRGHSLVLINDPKTLETAPLANNRNIAEALKRIGNSMDAVNDVLVLFLTSHGADGWISVDLPGFRLNQITPDGLATALDEAGITNRVLIISACHSGSFIPRLKNDNTLIMTAARADRTSFGCTNGAAWTYFGDALFNNALRRETDFIKAFEHARSLIETWEFWRVLALQKRSDPQISVGANIVKVLARLTSGVPEQRAEAVMDELRR